jgi:hypothetical protein
MSISLHSQTIHVSREKLITILETNLEKHVKEYNEAVDNYRKALMLDLTEALKQAQESSDLDKIKVDFIHPPVARS